MDTIASISLGQVEIANVSGEFIFRSCVWGFWYSKNGIDGFDAGLQDFFGYTIHVILGFWFLF
jgi:hypothetical protein